MIIPPAYSTRPIPALPDPCLARVLRQRAAGDDHAVWVQPSDSAGDGHLARTEPTGTIVVTAADTMLATRLLVADTTVTCRGSSRSCARSCHRSSPSRVSLYTTRWSGGTSGRRAGMTVARPLTGSRSPAGTGRVGARSEGNTGPLVRPA